MARQKPALDAIFKRTEPRAEDAPQDQAAASTGLTALPPAPQQAAVSSARNTTDKIVSVGVGLRESERTELDDLAAELGVTRNALMAWALRRFLKDYRAGRVDIPVERTTSARLQG